MPPDHRETTIAAKDERFPRDGSHRGKRSGTAPERLASPRDRPIARTESANDPVDHHVADRVATAAGVRSRPRETGQLDSAADVHPIDRPAGQRISHRVERPRVIAGIPAYNEGETVASVVEAVSEHVDRVVVVDDGSDDETAFRAARAGATVLRHERNRGYGAALRSIFEYARRQEATRLAIIDADGQHDPSDVPKLVDVQQSTGADVVIGSRFLGKTESNTPLYRRFGITIINVLTNVTLGRIAPSQYITDTQSGFRVYGPDAIQTLADEPDIGDSMSASTDIIFHSARHGFAIEETPTTVDYDVANANSENPLTHGLGVVVNILRRAQRERPIATLGVPGFVGLLLGLVIALWTLGAGDGLLPTVGTAIAVASIVAGFVLVGSALGIRGRGHPGRR